MYPAVAICFGHLLLDGAKPFEGKADMSETFVPVTLLMDACCCVEYGEFARHSAFDGAA